ncbi:hypothetical protein ACVIW2_002022 [Bradyrhizobium huanghuaihaiense]
MGRTVGCEFFRRLCRLVVSEPAVRGRANHNTHDILGAQACEFGDLILCCDDRPRLAAIEPVTQLVGGEQRGCGNHDDAELHRGEHRLPQRNHIAEQQQKMIAAPQALRAEEVRDLVGAARQRRKGQFCLFVLRSIDDPERGTVLCFGILRELIEPVERPVEGGRIGPAEAFDRCLVVRAVSQKKRARFLKCGHGPGPVD